MYYNIYIKQLLYRRKNKLEKKKTLNSILEEYQKIEMKIIDNQGEVDNNLEDLLNLNECKLKDKLDGYEGFVKYLQGQIEYLKNMESHYNKRRKILEKSVSQCKDSMVRAFSITGSTKIKTKNYNFSLCESESWEIDYDSLGQDVKDSLLSKGLAKNIFKLSMKDLKAAYKTMSDKEKPEWLMIDKKSYIRVS